MSKRPSFVRVARADEGPDGAVKHVFVQGKPMALCGVGGSFYAVNAVCLHVGGSLASGRLEGCILTCPWHSWTFDVRTGQPDHPAGHAVSTYGVRVAGNDVAVGWLKRHPI